MQMRTIVLSVTFGRVAVTPSFSVFAQGPARQDAGHLVAEAWQVINRDFGEKKKEIAELKKQRDDLEDALRHAAGPAGWAR